MHLLKNIILSAFILILLMPFVQSRKHVADEKPLFGIYPKAPPPLLKNITRQNWLHSVFQSDAEKGVNENLGFRNTLIRINNQVDFSLFGIIHAEGFVAGKSGMLYEEDYIHEYTGRYFIGKAALDKKVRRLKAVQEELGRRGTRLLFVIEPGKASFYPEYIPNRYHAERRTLTNMDYIKQRLDALDVGYIDLNSWYLAMKDTSRYKLFTEYGMHWSIYSVALVADSLSNYLREVYGARIPSFRIVRVGNSDSLRGSDRDIADMLNLVCPPNHTTAAYPVLEFDKTTPGLRVIAVADSYFNNLYYVYAPHLFANTEYWYYNSSLYYKDSYGATKVDHSGLPGKFKETDLILLMVSEINAHCGFWDFVDQAYEALFPPPSDTWVYRYENKIRNDRFWFRGMVRQAEEEGSTTEQAINRNARYAMCLDFDKLAGKTHYDSVVRIIHDIRSIPEWMHKVWTVSREQKRPLEDCLRSEAEYVLSQRKM